MKVLHGTRYAKQSKDQYSIIDVNFDQLLPAQHMTMLNYLDHGRKLNLVYNLEVVVRTKGS